MILPPLVFPASTQGHCFYRRGAVFKTIRFIQDLLMGPMLHYTARKACQ
jgi:hypothetical protein